MHIRTLATTATFATLFGLGVTLPAMADGHHTAVEMETEAVISQQEELVSQATIAEIVSGVEEFSTLEAALTAAELVEPLMGEGPFTVIAPSDDAFAALPDGVLDALLLPENADLLTDILTYHVIPGAVMSDDLETGTVETLGGEELPVLVADDAAFVDGISIVAFDIPATNGLIHVLQDGVLVPDDVAAALETRLAEAEEPMEEEEAMVEETMPMPETTPAEPVRGLW